MSYFDDPNVCKAALLIIGNEILSGRTKDKNGGYIAEKLTENSVALAEIRVVPDIEEKIIEAVNEMRGDVKYLFTTGGIGPTHDDITAASIAKALGRDLERNAEALQILENYYGIEELTEARKKMAEMPVGSKLIPNPVSGAPGFVAENIYVMAGVPRIMQAMLDHIIAEHLEGGAKVLSNTVSSSLPESAIAGALGDVQIQFPNIDIGSYPRFHEGKLGLSLVMRGVDEAALKDATIAVLGMLEALDGKGVPVELEVPLD